MSGLHLGRSGLRPSVVAGGGSRARGGPSVTYLPSSVAYVGRQAGRRILRLDAHNDGQPAGGESQTPRTSVTPGDKLFRSSSLPKLHGNKVHGDQLKVLEASFAASPSDGSGIDEQQEGAAASDAPTDVKEIQWASWLAYFQQADAAAERAEDMRIELKDVIAMERYSEAASLKSELDALDDGDVVGDTLRRLQTALSEERYSDAAALRDAGLTSLAGWWAGRADGDPVGHLLHMGPEYGRWTGRVLRPRDIAELKVGRGGASAPPPPAAGALASPPLPRLTGAPSGAAAQQPPSASAFSAPSAAAAGPHAGVHRPVGQPVLEVFVRSSDDAAGSSGSGATESGAARAATLSHQAVALRLPTFDEVERRRRAARPGTPGGPPLVEPAATADVQPAQYSASQQQQQSGAGRSLPVVRLSVSVLSDGTASIQLLPPNSGLSGVSGSSAYTDLPPDDRVDDDDHGLHTHVLDGALLGADGRASMSSPVSSSSYAGLPLPPDASTHNVMQSLSLDEVLDGEMDDDALHSMHSRNGMHGAPMAPFGYQHHVPRMDRNGGGTSFEAPEFDLEAFYTELAREPASIELVGKDHLVLTAPAHSFSLGGIPRGLAPRTTTPMSLSVPPALTSPSWQAIHPRAAAASASMTTSSFEVVMPLGELLAEAAAVASSATSSSEQQQAPTPAPPPIAPGLLSVLADQVASCMAAKVGTAAPTEEIADALHELMRRAAAGEPPSAVSVLLGARRPATSTGGAAADAPTTTAVGTTFASSAAAPQLYPLPPAPSPVAPLSAPHEQPPTATTSVVYRRIPADASRIDALCGLFLGSFGPHGPELLRLVRSTGDATSATPGEEMVQAVKLTGDANVPAGSVSFRACVGRQHRLDSRDVYPDELGIVARYKGEGLVAQKGFTQPRWVDGELLVFGGHGGPLTGGASLGFVWAVPGEKRFLILLNRVDLNDLAA
ncbi:hypothetical protein FOA52_014398 [Chlamydomonas sp. UWO 241]|nr:hypothetical protein FOA52_014398 [Chlamydomonas sp. UWO 241]